MTPKSKLKQLARIHRWRRYREFLVYAFSLAALVFITTNTLGYFDVLTRSILALILLVIVFVILCFRDRRITALHWAHHLDARFATLEDSTELLLQKPKQLNPIQTLQKNHVEQIFQELLKAGQIDQTMPPPKFGRILVSLFAVAILGNAINLLSSIDIQGVARRADSGTTPASSKELSIQITAPDYTGLDQRVISQGNFTAVEGSMAQWTVTTEDPAKDVEIRIHDQSSLTLERREDGTWLSEPWQVRSGVYQIAVDDTILESNTYQVSVTKDQTPRIRVEKPTNAVISLNTDSEMKVGLTAVVTDDFGIAETRLKLTLAQGSGEQVQFREVQHPLSVKEVDSKQKLVSATLDLNQIGLEPGAELYFFVEAQDNRSGKANVASSGTFIIKWPSEDDMDILPIDALAMDIMPEYFRSQRQIIIDTEALSKEKTALSEEEFNQRSQNIAFDQKLLRLRYGQFLGEEFESNIAATSEEMESEEHEHEMQDSHNYLDTIADVAHLHDQEEQATLFDPETRDLLKAALAEMWDAELNLRLMTPLSALPFENAALDYIKQVQQRSRIYLARVGFNPTPVDTSRRLSAELSEIQEQEVQTIGNDEALDLAGFVAALTQYNLNLAESIVPLSDLEQFIHPKIEDDVGWLAALTALKKLQTDPDCHNCMHDLSGALWQQLSDPVTVLHTPETSSKMATRFSDALAQQKEP